MAIGGMMKKVLFSVVDDDRFFRESMCRLMRSLGHTVDVFSSATEFLASPRLAETACLIAARTVPTSHRRGPNDPDNPRDGFS